MSWPRFPSFVWAIFLCANLVQSATTTSSQTASQTNNALHPWVTVAPDGATRTVTPTIDGEDTISTYNGPTALPTAFSDGSGAFLVCDEASGSGGLYFPFCASEKDKEVAAGSTYFITWDVEYFEDPGRGVVVEGALTNHDGVIEDQAFSSGPIVASEGFYAWTISETDPKSWKQMDVQLYLVYENGTSARNRISGPKLSITPPKQKSSFQLSFVILPVSFILLALVVAAIFVTVRIRKRRVARRQNGGWNGISSADLEAKDKDAMNSMAADDDFTWSAGGAEIAPPKPAFTLGAMKLNPLKRIRSLRRPVVNFTIASPTAAGPTPASSV
ncbi:hypothetical protein HYQ45_004024 [Verticillium longisporum]|uniref:Uncharacterized protein n=1 Tax=Verticillium longisporum TaxID=100787 RepID=A0A8I2ZW97_VERLO|nr:hypothetical protein HYQ45_004024 [Verticillium longisporum]